MSTIAAPLDPAVDTHLIICKLRKAADETTEAYEMKKKEQIKREAEMWRAIKTLRNERRPAPARRPEDDPSLYDEGRQYPMQIASINERAPQRTRPIHRMTEHWEIHGLDEARLYLTANGTFSRGMPSVVKANIMTEQLSFTHPLVVGNYEAILESLESMRIALKYV